MSIPNDLASVSREWLLDDLAAGLEGAGLPVVRLGDVLACSAWGGQTQFTVDNIAARLETEPIEWRQRLWATWRDNSIRSVLQGPPSLVEAPPAENLRLRLLEELAAPSPELAASTVSRPVIDGVLARLVIDSPEESQAVRPEMLPGLGGQEAAERAAVSNLRSMPVNVERVERDGTTVCLPSLATSGEALAR